MCPTDKFKEGDRDGISMMPISFKMNLGDIYRNQLMQFFFIMKKE